MSLYRRKGVFAPPERSYAENDDDVISIDDDEVDAFFEAKPSRAKRGRPPAANAKAPATSSSSTSSVVDSNNGPSTRKRRKMEEEKEKEKEKSKDAAKASKLIDLVVLSDDDEDGPAQDPRVMEKVRELRKRNGGSGSSSATEELSTPGIRLIDLEEDDRESDEITQSLRKIQSTISRSKQRKATAKAEDVVISEPPAVNSSSIFIPVVKTAQQRAQEAAALLAQRVQSSSSSSLHARAPKEEEEEEEDDGGEKMRFKTRLGNDDRPWSISSSAPLGNLKKKLSKLYNVPVDKISLFFDGEKIGDQDTAESRDMEEDDLIDVKMDKALIQPAIEHAKSKG